MSFVFHLQVSHLQIGPNGYRHDVIQNSAHTTENRFTIAWMQSRTSHSSVYNSVRK